MKIGFVVNDVATEEAGYTTTRLAMRAKAMGHEPWIMGLADFAYEADDSVSARARTAPGKTYRSLERFLADVQKPSSLERLPLAELDVLMLRADPAEDARETPWANQSLVAFGQLAAAAGVLVVNDPWSLSKALSKAYFQHFPPVVRPRTLISRDEEQIQEFIDELGGRAVLKPLQGSGGSGVFLVNEKQGPNTKQIIEAIARDGYVVTQEYLRDAKEGDVRMFVMNGQPLEVDGRIAAFRRRSSGSDMRSNVSAGGKIVPAEVTDEMLGLVEAVRPTLIEDGMFLVGLDIVGDKLMEVNVFTPGGLGSSEELSDKDFAGAVLSDLERKVRIRGHHGDGLRNATLATL